MKLELNKEQLELLEFVIQEFECQDDTERNLIEGIVSQIYDVNVVILFVRKLVGTICFDIFYLDF